MRTKSVESGKDRKTFARDAGMGQVSLISVLAGTLVAFASFAILLAITAAILSAIGIDTADLTSNDYEELGIGGAIVAALVLFLSYYFGGYIAGRLARRAGALNGGLVLLVALLIGAAVALVVGTQADTESLAADLRIVGVPTSGDDYGSVATIAGLVALAAMLAGAVLGGLAGERWHGKLAARAFSPDVGPAVAAPISSPSPGPSGWDVQGGQTAASAAPSSGNDAEARPWSTEQAQAAPATTSVTTDQPSRRRQRPLRSDSPRRTS